MISQHRRARLRARPANVALAVALASTVCAAAQQATPRPQLHLVKDVRLADQADAPRVSLVLRDGRVERVLPAGEPAPLGAREIDGKGMLAVPAFIDVFTQAGCETPTPKADADLPKPEVSDVQVDMRDANRKGIQPAFRAAAVFNLPKEKGKGWRESGFGAVLSAPAGQLLAGTSALATTREAAARDALIEADVFSHAAFRAAGGGYPSTLMGYYSQLRQFFLDVQHQAEVAARYADGRPGPRPPFDADLEAGERLASKARRVMCEAETAQDILRWIALGDELGWQIGIVGGREAWRVADVLRARSIPVVLTLEWGDEPKDPHEKDKQAQRGKQPEETKPGEAQAGQAPPGETKPDEQKPDAKKAEEKRWEYEEPLGVREAKRAKWEEGRDCALGLHKAGVEFAFGSSGGSAADLLKKVRTLVERGLPPDAALAALTSGAAQLLGAQTHLGAIRQGADATLALWTAHPTAKDAKLAWLFVDGFPYELELDSGEQATGAPDEGLDATGTWTAEIKTDQGARAATLELVMTPDGDVSGTLRMATRGGEERAVECKGHVGGKTMTLEGSYSMRDIEVTMRWKVELAGDSFSGTSTTKGPWGETTSDVSGTRKPKSGVQESEQEEEGCDDHP